MNWHTMSLGPYYKHRRFPGENDGSCYLDSEGYCILGPRDAHFWSTRFGDGFNRLWNDTFGVDHYYYSISKGRAYEIPCS